MNHKFIGVTTTANKRWCEVHDKFEAFILPVSRQYIAGLFDGEGWVSLKNQNGKSYMRWKVTITNRNKGVLEVIKSQYGGRMRSKTKQRECWDLELDTKPTIKRFLTEIEPYLIIKKERAIKCLELLNIKREVSKKI